MNKEEGMEMLKNSGLAFSVANDIKEAAHMITQITKGKNQDQPKETTKETNKKEK
jgi:succinyl-CoA synthetase beta subunit